jgi:hypothetical protein
MHAAADKRGSDTPRAAGEQAQNVNDSSPPQTHPTPGTLACARQEKRQFNEKFVRVEVKRLCELTSGADALKMRTVVDLASRQLARMIEGKSPEQIRAIFHLPDDLTEEEKLEPIRNVGEDARIRLLNRLYAKKRQVRAVVVVGGGDWTGKRAIVVRSSSSEAVVHPTDASVHPSQELVARKGSGALLETAAAGVAGAGGATTSSSSNGAAPEAAAAPEASAPPPPPPQQPTSPPAERNDSRSVEELLSFIDGGGSSSSTPGQSSSAVAAGCSSKKKKKKAKSGAKAGGGDGQQQRDLGSGGRLDQQHRSGSGLGSQELAALLATKPVDELMVELFPEDGFEDSGGLGAAQRSGSRARAPALPTRQPPRKQLSLQLTEARLPLHPLPPLPADDDQELVGEFQRRLTADWSARAQELLHERAGSDLLTGRISASPRAGGSGRRRSSSGGEAACATEGAGQGQPPAPADAKAQPQLELAETQGAADAPPAGRCEDAADAACSSLAPGTPRAAPTAPQMSTSPGGGGGGGGGGAGEGSGGAVVEEEAGVAASGGAAGGSSSSQKASPSSVLSSLRGLDVAQLIGMSEAADKKPGVGGGSGGAGGGGAPVAPVQSTRNKLFSWISGSS